MHFAPDTDEVLRFGVVLANTAPAASRSGLDELATPGDLTALLDEFRVSGRFDRDATELAAVHAFRDELRALWVLDRDAMAERVNVMLRETAAQPRLERHGGFDWHLHTTPLDAPLIDRIRAESALALVDIVRTDETKRMRVCAASDCTGLLIDLSRNGSKRFCSVRCSNRVSMIAFRERKTDGLGGAATAHRPRASVKP